MKTFLKYAGGKAKLAAQILERFPASFNDYYEPFVGGGAVFFALEPERYATAVLSDTNLELMWTYEAVRDSVDELVRILSNMQDKHNKDFYERVRAKDVRNLSPIQAAARMLYLNATCFNGLYRVNKAGQFNVPIGNYKDPAICKEQILRACSERLRDAGRLSGVAELHFADFEATLANVHEGDVVYFDPPYVPLSRTSSFVGYGSDGFGATSHARLARVFRQMVDKGVHVVLSNSDTPLTRELYAGFEMHEVEAARAINSKASKRGKVRELLIVGRRA